MTKKGTFCFFHAASYWKKQNVPFFVLAVGLCGCASPRATSCLLGSHPVLQHHSIEWHLVDVSTLSQLQRAFEGACGARCHRNESSESEEAAAGFLSPREPALLQPDEVRRGPTVEESPQPPFVVTRLKGEGKTAGFFVHDARGQRYLFKLDLSSWPELLSGAEVVSSKLLHALGYHVPSYEILDVRPGDFAMKDGAVGLDLVHALLAGRLREGRLRVSASRLLDGEVLGPLQFEYYRSCRAVRALRVAYAWLNNTDAKDHNTLVVRQQDQTRAYLIDFGTSLGANAMYGAKRPREGRLYDFELRSWLMDVLTLGFYNRWLDARTRPFSQAVGLFSERLEPRRWKPYAPNLAFAAMTENDARWMAGRIAALSRAQLAAAVSAGRYSHPEDAARIVEVLEARQEAIVKAYLADMEE